MTVRTTSRPLPASIDSIATLRTLSDMADSLIGSSVYHLVAFDCMYRIFIVILDHRDWEC
jgi:hypothetical protein